ncbi:hypothetical protein [Achromobacter xylosoxidans]|uniref:Uncharacterized protein n=1 Tax=Alcaligenes xylosoxydans xylosoxydans TaxID=85698 RepID=A0A1R1JLG1_ALCXX|nr:hypothetical protein [Achromobacter xylosoxidans]OMG77918.1 hypothetical protein BIZ92_16020 [Achromobacter xylosoxidans]BEG78677.1 hypothetical protein HBIAX_05782 [Achromobacter xylosoxidans]
MPHHPSDPGIPTLTQRAEPTLSPSAPPVGAAHGATDTYPDDAFPLLTEVADADVPVLTDPAGGDDFPLLTDPVDDHGVPLLTDAPDDGAGTAMPSDAPPPAILAARLQAEVEQAMRAALADAITRIQAHMDEELPRIVARVLRDVRPG